MGFKREIKVTKEDVKLAEQLVADSDYSAYIVYEKMRQECRKLGTTEGKEGLIEALSELSKADGDKAVQSKKKGIFK